MSTPPTADPATTDSAGAVTDRDETIRILEGRLRRGRWFMSIALLLVIAVAAAAVAFMVVTRDLVERDRVGSPVDPAALPVVIGDWEGEQIEIAAAIVAVAQERGISTRGQEIAVMVAMGESSLENIEFGDDVLNPDGSMSCSLGIYQQQWCLEGEPWGSREQVLDPAHATGVFLDRMVQVPGWEELPPTIVGHRVQINADAYHYAPYFGDAQLIVAVLTDVAPVP